ncbi:MAG TPA: UDP-2,3-diacylglucosamine diphosphatase [Solimonas sp.]|nr:UDP-2,3-diacylglucosamine diphosphatase [Solimonas sp.]
MPPSPDPVTRRTLLLSDLHLPVGPSPYRDAFQRFLEGPARQAEAVYILGDLFEYWIGDDLGMLDYAPEVGLLAKLTQHGVKVCFQRGNRDFLVGQDFADLSGVQLLHDPFVVDLYGTPTLLSHGDLLCTDDAGYQRWRRFAHNRAAQSVFLTFPRRWRERVAQRVRGRSNAEKRYKPEDIMDVNVAAVQAFFKLSGARRLIHGHTHRPAEHVLDGGCERVVLADWRPERKEVLEASPQGLRRILL